MGGEVGADDRVPVARLLASLLTSGDRRSQRREGLVTRWLGAGG